MRSTIRAALPVIAAISLVHGASAQTTKTAFTAEDMLKVASVSVLDITDDGGRVAATVRRPSDNDTTDNRRYGDPTYLSPSRVTLQVIDARSGAIETPFTSLVNVRDAAWSKDGKRLAILIGHEEGTPSGFPTLDRKSTRLNSSHLGTSYA